MFGSKLKFSLALWIALSFSAPLSALAEVVRSTERGIAVTYGDGFVEKYVAAYTGIVNVSREERGGPAKPLEGRFIDDRQCFWSIQTFVQRQIYAMNRQGQRAILEQLNNRFETNFANKGSDFVLLRLRPESCADAQGRYESDISNGRQAIQNQFEAIVANDLQTLKNLFNQATSIDVK